MNFIAVYLEDLLIASLDIGEMCKVNRLIADAVQVVDKDPVKYFLSLEVDRIGDKGKISISQKSQIRRLLQDHNMRTCRPTATPLHPKHQVRFDNDGCQKVDQTECQSVFPLEIFKKSHKKGIFEKKIAHKGYFGCKKGQHFLKKKIKK